MPSAEHEFLVLQLDRSLKMIEGSALFGVVEAERKKFDYGCILQRDMSRPLVAQVLWSHQGGIDKDLRTLLHDPEALLKVYLVRSTTSHRMRIDEVIQSYRIDPSLRPKLAGLKLLPIPDNFDADDQKQQEWMAMYVAKKLIDDILFGVLFGRLNEWEFGVFVDHNGPLGLKLAILDEISTSGLESMPRFKEKISYKTDGPIREAIAMLSAAGFVRRLPQSVVCLPTVKGRLMLDLTKRLLFERDRRAGWTPETLQILETLGIFDPPLPMSQAVRPSVGVESLLTHSDFCSTQFGRDLLADVDLAAPCFYSSFERQLLLDSLNGMPGITEAVFDEPEFLFFPRGQQ